MADMGSSRGNRAGRMAKRRAFSDATWRVFMREGLVGTTARAIAAETGKSVGSLYSYYPSTEAVVRELVLGSLAELARNVSAVAGGKAGARNRIVSAVDAIAKFYGANSRGAELLPMLLHDAKGDEGDETGKFVSRMNGKLIAALVPVADAFRSLGLSQQSAQAKTLGLACFVLGLVMLESSGRLEALGVSRDSIIGAYLSDTFPP
jgi:AcrR family transcriptional regulator